MSSIDLRTGTSVVDFAIVLDRLVYKESDVIFSLITSRYGKISALAKGAARSLKRFGAVVETGNLISAQLKVPKERSATHSPIWFFDGADLRGQYPHFRKSYQSIESYAFLLNLIKETLPDGHVDAALFSALGRFLRDSDKVDFYANGTLYRLCFWSWISHHLGFGNIDLHLREKIQSNVGESFLQLWSHVVESKDCQPLKIFEFWKDSDFPMKADSVDERHFYESWIERSGLAWKHFERWHTQ